MGASRDWQKTDPDLRAHPRFKQLVRLLATTEILADGLLSGLWRMAYRQAEDGDLSRFSADALAAAAGWDSEPESMLQALKDAEFVSNNGCLSSWDDWGGSNFKEREKWAAKKGRQRVPLTSPGRPGDPRAKTKTKSKSYTHMFENDFASWWEAYGKLGSRADAELLYVHWRERGATPQDLLAAATNYRAHCAQQDSIMLHGRTFLAKKPNRWQEWVTPEDKPATRQGAPASAFKEQLCPICKTTLSWHEDGLMHCPMCEYVETAS